MRILAHTHAMSEQRPWSALSVLATAWLSFVVLLSVSAVHPFNCMFICWTVKQKQTFCSCLSGLFALCYRNCINRTNNHSTLREMRQPIWERKTTAGQLLHWNGKRNWSVCGNAIFVCQCFFVQMTCKAENAQRITDININIFKFVQDTLTPSIGNKDLEILYH